MDSTCDREQYPNHDFFTLPLPSGRNQSIVTINQEVIPMNQSKNISPRSVLAYIAMLAGAMVTTMLVPAYGQQEVAPDWYDPYAVTVPSPAPSAAVAHTAQPAVAFHRDEVAVKSVASTGISGKSRGKQPATQPQTADISLPKDRNQQE
jgi:hypothetical protein